jgi:hypothetical protein
VVAEWEEPRHPGPLNLAPQYPTFPHFATHLPAGRERGRRRVVGDGRNPALRAESRSPDGWGALPAEAGDLLHRVHLHALLQLAAACCNESCSLPGPLDRR